MIYITQLVFIKKGKESTFIEFEKWVLPLMKKYTGKMLYRIRPDKEAFISETGELPYEIHFMSFDSDEKLSAFMSDPIRLNFIHLKEESIKSTILVKGLKM